MKYASISITIVGIWIIMTVAILAREDASPIVMMVFALANTVWLAMLGFRAPRHPDAK
ncbi:MAG: hypothetical protein AAB483_02520 [Patescibacteria group bacterium]